MAMRLVCLIGLVACAGKAWRKPGATAEDFGRAKWECRLYSKALNDNTTWSKGFTEGLLFKECMRDHGWLEE